MKQSDCEVANMLFLRPARGLNFLDAWCISDMHSTFLESFILILVRQLYRIHQESSVQSASERLRNERQCRHHQGSGRNETTVWQYNVDTGIGTVTCSVVASVCEFLLKVDWSLVRPSCAYYAFNFFFGFREYRSFHFDRSSRDYDVIVDFRELHLRLIDGRHDTFFNYVDHPPMPSVFIFFLTELRSVPSFAKSQCHCATGSDVTQQWIE